MKSQTIGFVRRRLRGVALLTGVQAVILLLALQANAQTDQILPPIGGGGGSQYVARCPQGRFLTGFELRIGDDIDNIRPLCAVAVGPSEAGPLEPYPSKFGGDGGGGDRQLLCPDDAPAVLGIEVGFEGRPVTVNNIHLFCGQVSATPQRTALPSAVFDGPVAVHDRGPFDDDFAAAADSEFQRCEAGLVAVGINGRSGRWLDSLGLICGAPRVPHEPVRAGGRVKLPEPVQAGGRVKLANLDGLAAKGEALVGRERLALDLRSLHPEGPARRGFNIGMAVAEKDILPGPGKVKVRDQLSPAERTGFDAAVSFALTRNKKKFYDLAPKGAEIAGRDPLTVMLRNQQPAGPVRLGFDIGMAVAEKDTEPGPGKRAIQATLSPEEQKGFAMAVAFLLDRNRNAKLASVGAAMAKADVVIREVRATEIDAFYWLGFDIASGLFGDRAKGGGGSTMLGPGSLKIRAALSPAARRGFDRSSAMHFARTNPE